MQLRSSNWIYQYSPRPGRWTEITPSPADGEQRGDENCEDFPLPRYAHQAVYDPTTKTVYIHGGNAGISESLEKDGDEDDGEKERERENKEDKIRRMDDFWSMTLVRQVLSL